MVVVALLRDHRQPNKDLHEHPRACNHLCLDVVRQKFSLQQQHYHDYHTPILDPIHLRVLAN
ncbi:hypothetical protein BpHYR1_007479 [Brachionus plicatilis]|uniref:Uncharacterized protein n=1 Tax=Brachionus plicatilis TaxID=10195 RepID=A0A3M7Q568_BRAPC|nr:hypothetical protein BpHYR1_007479 [Brachionus plicatilis]